MSVDAELFKMGKSIESGQSWPRPLCPSCPVGHIDFASPQEHESLKSEREHPYFDPEWIHGTFDIQGRCTNPGCLQVVHAAGDYQVEHSRSFDISEIGEFMGVPYSAYYSIRQVHPPLLIMSIPKSAPSEIREAIVRASRVLFADPGLAATALRATVERFLTVEGIPAVTASGKFQTAHQRINEWKTIEPKRESVAELLHAVKWLGNVGTHEDSKLKSVEVLEGAKLLDEAFHRLFDSPDIDKYARAVNSAKGPPAVP